MKKRICGISVAVLTAVCMLTGCGDGKNYTPDTSGSDVSSTVSNVFNDERYQDIISNIQIRDRTISMPCTLADLGEDFTVDTNSVYVDANLQIAVYFLSYQGVEIGSLEYRTTEKLSEEALQTTPFCTFELDPQFSIREDGDMKVGGITIGDHYATMIKLLGDPTEIPLNFKEGYGYVYYRVSDSQSIDFHYENNILLDITVRF